MVEGIDAGRHLPLLTPIRSHGIVPGLIEGILRKQGGIKSPPLATLPRNIRTYAWCLCRVVILDRGEAPLVWVSGGRLATVNFREFHTFPSTLWIGLNAWCEL
jgi:hypothetical protein